MLKIFLSLVFLGQLAHGFFFDNFMHLVKGKYANKHGRNWFISSVATTQFDAVLECVSLWGGNGRLARIEDEQQNAWLTELSNGTSMYIGMETSLENKWQWFDGCPVGYKNVVDGQSTGKCMTLSTDGKWLPTECAEKHNFVCREMVLDDICSHVSVTHNDQQYIISTLKKSWDDALHECQSLWKGQGQLVRIDNSEETSFITNHTADISWIGLKNDGVSADWVWSDGCPMAFADWFDDQPSVSPGCASLTSYDEGQWTSQDCSEQLSFVCRREAEPACKKIKQADEKLGAADKQYFFSSQKVTRGEAAKACQAEPVNGRLVTVDDAAAAAEIAKHTNHQEVWIGPKLDKKASRYSWEDKCPMVFNNWEKSAAASADGTGECATLKPDDTGSWKKESCHKNFGFMCEMGEPQPCTTQHVLHNNKNYSISYNLLTQQEAAQHCRSLFDGRGLLATVDDEALSTLLHKSTSEHIDKLWLGLHRSNKKESVWKWADKCENNFTNWAANFPKNNYYENNLCVVSNMKMEGKWENVKCDEKAAFVCEEVAVKDRCGYKKLEEVGGEYYISDIELPWKQAKKECGKLWDGKGRLAEINSKYENTFLYENLEHDDSLYLLGGSKINDQWKWKKCPLVYTNWEPTEMLSSAEEDEEEQQRHVLHTGLSVKNEGAWTEVKEGTKAKFICQKFTTKDFCKELGFNSEKFFISHQKVRWSVAKDFCKSLFNGDGQLAHVANVRENKWLYRNAKHQDVWIGASDVVNQNNTWEWTDKCPLKYENFKNKKSKVKGECGMMAAKDYGKWLGKSCDTLNGFVCKEASFSTRCHYKQYTMPKSITDINDDIDFYISDQKVTWERAQAICTTLWDGQGLLARLDNEHDNAWAFNNTMEKQATEFWLGLHTTEEQTWHWEDDCPLTYSQLADKNVNMTNQYCAVLQHGREYKHKWDKKRCSQEAGFVCRKMIGRCEFKQFNENDYFFSHQYVNFESSKATCEELWDGAGSLATVDSKEENDFLLETLKGYEENLHRHYQIGLRAAEATQYNFQNAPEDGNFIFTAENPLVVANGKKLTPTWIDHCPAKNCEYYKNVYSNFGDNIVLKKNYCGSLEKDRKGKWYMHKCGYVVGYVCKKQIFRPNCGFHFNIESPESQSKRRLQKYFFSRQQTTWDTAKKYCANELKANYMLSRIDSQKSQHIIAINIPGKSKWIGLSENGGNDTKWLDQCPVVYDNYGVEQEVVTADRSCVMMNRESSALWMKKDCDAFKSGFLCQEIHEETCTYHEWDKHDYFISKQAVHRPTAEEACKTFWNGTGLLTSLRSKQESSEFKSLATEFSFWFGAKMGFNAAVGKKVWNWPNNCQVMYNNFDTTQKDNGGECAALMYQHPKVWEKVDCNKEEFGFICKKTKRNDRCGNVFLTINKGHPILETKEEYYVGDTGASWEDAKHNCEVMWAETGELVSINSELENNFLFKDKEEDHWIGAFFDTESSDWKWTNRCPVVYKNFDGGNSSTAVATGNVHGCVVMTAAGVWKEADCSEEKQYICKRRRHKEECEITSYNKKTHFHSKQLVSWPVAKDFCKGKSLWDSKGRLVTIRNNAKNQWISTKDDNATWIGANDVPHQNGSWKWADDCPITHTDWGQGQPTKGQKQFCGLLEHDGPTWVSENCQLLSGFMCELVKDDEICEYKEAYWNKTDYLIVYRKENWYDAHTFCETLWSGYGRLVRIDSLDENNFIHRELENNENWIALSYDPERGFWHWDENCLMEFNNFEKSYPIMKYGKKRCAYQGINGTWLNEDCTDYKTMFACEKTSIEKTANFIYNSEGEFYISNQEQTWEDAKFNCEQLWNKEGALVHVQNSKINQFVTNQLQQMRSDVIWTAGQWTGGEDGESSNNWFWKSKTKCLFSHQDWADSQQTDLGESSNKCAKVDKEDGGRWSVGDCPEKHGFICQRIKEKDACGSFVPMVNNQTKTEDQERVYVSQNQMTWWDASNFCDTLWPKSEEYKGILMDITSAEVNTVTKELLEYLDDQSEHFWINLRVTDRHWYRYNHGRCAPMYENWEPGNDHYLRMASGCGYINKKDGYHAAADCNKEKMKFVCMKASKSSGCGKNYWNLARDQHAFQGPFTGFEQVASFAVDGVKSNSAQFCSYTESYSDWDAGTKTKRENETLPINWWYVDLEHEAHIEKVILTNRRLRQDRLNKFSLSTGNVKPDNSDGQITKAVPDGFNLCTYRDDADFLSLTIVCPENVGRYVLITIPTNVLTLCEVEVFGIYKENWNIAQHKRAFQSSMLNYASDPMRSFLLHGPANAIDGNVNSDLYQESCTQTGSHTDFSARTEIAWWYVDMGQSYEVEKVKLYNRGDCCQERLQDFTVSVGTVKLGHDEEHQVSENNLYPEHYRLCGHHIEIADEITTLACDNIAGRYVAVVKKVSRAKQDYLTLCEVKVFGKRVPREHVMYSNSQKQQVLDLMEVYQD